MSAKGKLARFSEAYSFSARVKEVGEVAPGSLRTVPEDGRGRDAIRGCARGCNLRGEPLDDESEEGVEFNAGREGR